MTDSPRPARAASAKLLAELATRAGIEVEWDNAQHVPQRVSDDVLRTLLERLDLPCASAAQARDSLALLEAEQRRNHVPKLLSADVDHAIALPSSTHKTGTRYRIDLEQGGTIEGILSVPRGETALLAPIAETGYHTLTIDNRQCTLAIAPRHCYGVADAMAAAGRPSASRGWGIGAQLYGLREAADGGIGTYGALARAAQRVGAQGGDALAISPVHAMFSAQPHKFSPYSPSSRLFLNVLHIDPAAAFGEAAARAAIQSLGLERSLAELEALALIDWPRAAHARLAILRSLFEQMLEGRFGEAPLRELDRFRAQGGKPLEDHARFEAIQGAFLAISPDAGYWRDWPVALRDPNHPAVADAVAPMPREVTYHVFLQWLAQRGLADAQAQARASGMAIGLVADLAVGCDSAGSHAWSYPAEMLHGVSVGAPPDLFNQVGQAWGLTTFSPRGMVAQGFGAFLDMLRAAFRHAGGVRIDHILGLRRLWLVPDGSPARDGAYLHYPFDDLLRLIALESWRHRAIVIGEDLGTVPGGMRERLADSQLLGIRVLWFERKKDAPDPSEAEPAGPPVDRFIAPERWSEHAVATTTTHDLPTVTGWWAGDDIVWRDRIGQTARLASGEDPVALAHLERRHDRTLLWDAFRKAGVAPADAPPPDDAPVDEALAFIARTPSPLVVYPLEDLLGLADQPNLPGSIDEHPNWRRRVAAPFDALTEQPGFADRLRAIRRLFSSS
ncbi:4-alpha-glucanotransferase [Pararobbsia silviterrae]|uniref:4-alpha-glucanotransferase n=1 Tax=Pararobbsia silviterrae TaxID=1792498 RepID=A0A494Y444_9BURK|nr:4-alpha-glucanotransferase [Pararobbsia silviterrae]RKP57509.1 4-alpha-glucanotransferase [Pararobbsia silviterrae]